MLKVQANVVTQVPQLTAPVFVSGIRDVPQAREWGEKHGYSVVYFLASKQRAYADRLATNVAEQAKQIERKSAALVVHAENGGAEVEIAVFALLVLFLIVFLGERLGWAW